jgi:hypothetical protein
MTRMSPPPRHARSVAARGGAFLPVY